MRVVVVGGGLAGLTAALDLVDAGEAVTVLEARPTLGGAVQTLPEREGDPPPAPDNGQHISLGCCSAYLAFLDRVGSAAGVSGSRSSYGHRRAGCPIGDPSGLLGLLRYRHLSLGDRLAVARVSRRLAKLDPDDHDGESFGSLLRRLGQSQTAIDRFWDVFVRPALNIESEEASAELALFTVQTALFGGRGASDLVLPIEPLGAIHGDAAGLALTEAGAEVRTRARVTGLEPGAAVLSDGERVAGDAFVVALPPGESAALLDEPAPDSRIRRS